MVFVLLLIAMMTSVVACDDDDDETDMVTSSQTMTEEPTVTDDGDMENTYADLTPAEAKQMIDGNPDLVVIDVSPDYENGHLPRAMN